ncbi:PilN domain-containing protein [Desulforamulus hydrothermalis]|uniref:Putative Fimbrial assembly family protein n=1 Tax=Desulforamulus hydrothermalis Lam5 = DSM 18033 TaxID=1121428 RepID=K8E0D0_9FIRM|nr:putative Fimbrial assembly family protein [Desulforamulus hydrothermalis]CCO08875.1 putative Fimbrial assembly family protein [Desulforamulus hydrothermalis Lam5 = DSM 18033]SHG73760.1 type IV pilus assembly protein PilN [Desulforamulus hydrothermalis Lam5 = DSM 18033]
MYKINLLPPCLQCPGNKIKVNYLWLGAAVAVILFAGCLLFYCRLSAGHRQLAQARQELAQLQPRVAATDKLTASLREQQAIYDQMYQVLHNRLTWYRLLQDLPLALPADTWVNRLEIHRAGGLPGHGGPAASPAEAATAAQGNQPAPDRTTGAPAANLSRSAAVSWRVYICGSCWDMESVGVLLHQLSRLPYFASIQLTEARYDRLQGIVKFELTAAVKGGARHDKPTVQP